MNSKVKAKHSKAKSSRRPETSRIIPACTTKVSQTKSPERSRMPGAASGAPWARPSNTSVMPSRNSCEPWPRAELGRKTVDHAGGNEMNAIRIAAIVVIVAGILGLVYGGFSYTKDTQEAKLGPIELSVKDKQTVSVPAWAGVGAILIGGALLFVG